MSHFLRVYRRSNVASNPKPEAVGDCSQGDDTFNRRFKQALETLHPGRGVSAEICGSDEAQKAVAHGCGGGRLDHTDLTALADGIVEALGSKLEHCIQTHLNSFVANGDLSAFQYAPGTWSRLSSLAAPFVPSNNTNDVQVDVDSVSSASVGCQKLYVPHVACEKANSCSFGNACDKGRIEAADIPTAHGLDSLDAITYSAAISACENDSCDGITYNAAISACEGNPEAISACEGGEEMHTDVITYNATFSADEEVAINACDKGVEKDSGDGLTYNAAISACEVFTHSAAISACEKDSSDDITYNAAISACEVTPEAFSACEGGGEMPTDVITYNATISACEEDAISACDKGVATAAEDACSHSSIPKAAKVEVQSIGTLDRAAETDIDSILAAPKSMVLRGIVQGLIEPARLEAFLRQAIGREEEAVAQLFIAHNLKPEATIKCLRQL